MCNVVAEFVTWLFDLVVACFFPGASYQRQKTGEEKTQYDKTAPCPNVLTHTCMLPNHGLRVMPVDCFLHVFSNAPFRGHLRCIFTKMAARQEEGSATRYVCGAWVVRVCLHRYVWHNRVSVLSILSSVEVK